MDSRGARQAPFRWLTIVALALTLLPALAQRGMFVDGVTYATIARNLARGVGSWWAPSYTQTVYTVFCEHLPLGFWLESLAFRLLGDHAATERIYSLVAALMTAALMTKVWRAAFRDDQDAQHFEWAPVLIWASVPFVVWGAVNNILEVTMAVFSTGAVLLTLEALASPRARTGLASACAAGLATTAALLTKNPVGLFPLLLVPCAWALARPRASVSRVVMVWATMGAVVIAAVGLLLAFEAPRHLITEFLNQQLLPAISGQREVANDRFGVVRSIVYGIGKRMLTWPAVLLVVLLAMRRLPVLRLTHAREAACFLGMALLASLPIMVSRKQATHYLIPSVPFYAMAVAAVCLDSLRLLSASLSERAAGATTTVMKAALPVVVVLALVLGPRFGRDRARLDDIDRIGQVVPAGSTIGVCPELAGDWGLHAYFARLQNVSLDPGAAAARAFVLAGTAPQSCSPPGTCRKIVAANSLVLYRCDGQ
jgi:hypothetical protein